MKNNYKVRIDNINQDGKYYLTPVDRIYCLDEYENLLTDIDNLMRLRNFKMELEDKYYGFMENELKDWDAKRYPIF